MDKLTLTRPFWIQFGILLRRYREGIGMSEYRFIQKKRFSIDSNAIPMGYRDRGGGKPEDFT